MSEPVVSAVVVTYRPAEELEENLRAIIAEFGRVIVVDNGSGDETVARLRSVPGVSLVPLPTNHGIAVALNRGINQAAEEGATHVVTFDQDSRVLPGFAAALIATQRRLPDAAVVGPNIEQAVVLRPWRWLQPHHCIPVFFRWACATGGDISNVTMVLTSGALTEVACWRALGGFDERLFIDYVDTEYCLRCRAAGRTIAVSAAARLVHQLGHRERRRWLGIDFYPTHHAPLRHYYIARNRVFLIRRYGGREPHWLVFDISAFGFWMFRVMVFEHDRRAKAYAVLAGTWDGLRGRTGPSPSARQHAIARWGSGAGGAPRQTSGCPR